MNRTSISASALLTLVLSCTTLAQSSFLLRNLDPRGVDAPIFDAQGVPLAGPGYLAELWGGASAGSLAPAVVIDQGNRREIVAFAASGYFISDASRLSVLTVLPSGWAWLEVRAWDGRLGGTYEEAAARGLGGYGESPLFYAQGGNPSDLLGTSAPLLGLQSFSLRPLVPEPSSWLLLASGVGGLVLGRHRRKAALPQPGPRP